MVRFFGNFSIFLQFYQNFSKIKKFFCQYEANHKFKYYLNRKKLLYSG